MIISSETKNKWKKLFISKVLPAIGIVLNSLREDLATAHIFNLQRQPLSVLDLLFVNGFKAGLLQLAVSGPDDLATGIHGHCRFFPSDLDENGALVVAQSNIVGATQNSCEKYFIVIHESFNTGQIYLIHMYYVVL